MMMMMMMPRLQKWGSFFLPLKQNLSLSFSRAQNTQPRAREELLPRREWRPLSDLSLLLLLLRKSAQRAQVLLLSCKNKSCCFSLFCLLGKMKLSLQKNCSYTVSGSCVLFCPLFNSFFLRVRFGSFECFFQPTRGRKSRSTPNTLFSRLLWENSLLSLLSIRLGRIIHTITFPYSIFFFFL